MHINVGNISKGFDMSTFASLVYEFRHRRSIIFSLRERTFYTEPTWHDVYNGVYSRVTSVYFSPKSKPFKAPQSHMLFAEVLLLLILNQSEFFLLFFLFYYYLKFYLISMIVVHH